MSPAVAAWLARAVADANARNLPELAPLLESLAKSLQALRDADEEFGHPGTGDPGSGIGNPEAGSGTGA